MFLWRLHFGKAQFVESFTKQTLELKLDFCGLGVHSAPHWTKEINLLSEAWKMTFPIFFILEL